MSYQNLLVENKEGLTIITINREDKLNALNHATMDEIDAVFQQVYDDPSIKGVILTGKGNKAFVAGADISEFSELNYMNGRKFAERGQEIFAKIENCPKPVIAAVNGYALGGGCELAMSCHIRIASENASFGLPEVSLGIMPGYGGTQRLPLLVGKGRAFEMILTGDRVNAQEAAISGLANKVVPLEQLMETCITMMNRMLSKAPLALAQAIDCINAAYSGQAGYQTEANAFGNCCKTEDFIEGTSAFLEKRKPVFLGK